MSSLSISPQQIEYLIKPGATIIQSFRIKNDSNDYIYLNTSIEAWQPLGDDGLVSYQNNNTNNDIEFSLNNSDLQLYENFSIEPHTEKQLVLKIKASPYAKESDHYTTFFITQSNSLKQTSTPQSQTNIKIGYSLTSD